MSAYVVEDTTIAQILSTIEHHHDCKRFGRHCPSAWATCRILADACIPFDTPENLRIFGQQLLSLNQRAVNARYDEDEPIERYEHRAVNVPSLVQSYKSLRCLICQCTEGDVPKSELYRTLKVLAGAWAEGIVEESPAYNAAKWG